MSYYEVCSLCPTVYDQDEDLEMASCTICEAMLCEGCRAYLPDGSGVICVSGHEWSDEWEAMEKEEEDRFWEDLKDFATRRQD